MRQTPMAGTLPPSPGHVFREAESQGVGLWVWWDMGWLLWSFPCRKRASTSHRCDLAGRLRPSMQEIRGSVLRQKKQRLENAG